MGTGALDTRPGPAGAASASQAESTWADTALGAAGSGDPLLPRGPRTRLLVLSGLIGAALLVLWLHMLATTPAIDLDLAAGPDGRLVLQASTEPDLQPAIGSVLHSIAGEAPPALLVNTLLLPQSARWLVADRDRQQHRLAAEQLAQLLLQPRLILTFDDGLQVPVTPHPRGLARLGPACWLLGALALGLYGVGVIVLLERPAAVSALYAVLAVIESASLLMACAGLLPGSGMPVGFSEIDLMCRLLAEAVFGAALVHALLHYPQVSPALLARPGLPWLVWLVLPGMALLLFWLRPASLWWWAQGLGLAAALAALGVLHRSLRSKFHPVASLLLRLTAAGAGTLLLLTAAVALANPSTLAQHRVAGIGSTLWHVFVAALLMLAPFLSRTRRAVRELALLAGVSTVACSLDLVFIAVLDISQAAAITLALGSALLLYVLVRHWALRQLAGASALSAERMFESLYRAARELEQHPEQTGEQLAKLLREVFDPLELASSRRSTSRCRLARDGTALLVPVPQLGPDSPASDAIVLRFAHRGRRVFTQDDLQLTERIIEQLRRAVAYDRAVEHGRAEERIRIAQDLHDDIGARLLTLMYKAPDPEIEDYIRHTLQDLKTLTRGLATGNQRLSHAAAEWKADLSQRLAAAGCSLRWSFSCDRDFTMTMVQWSGLTRVLRELVNNILTHAQATQVEVQLQVDRQQLLLLVSDDGGGRAPQAWSHGLGLGGVRKRVKLLGGEVSWRERQPRGIRCEVRALLASDRQD